MSISISARIWHTLLRKIFMGHKRSIAEFRAIKSSKLMGGIPKTVKAERVEIDGTQAEWLIPADANLERVIIYLHGGGYVSGSIETHRALCGLLANHTGAKILVVEYRLAPEHPFPAALDDSLKVYHWLLLKGYSASNIIFCGDSAGGGLSVATVLALKDKKESLPAAVICLSPWVDLTLKNETHITKAKVEAMIRDDVLREWAFSYTDESNFKNSLVSPVYADFHGFPPLFIQVGSNEILLDDSILLAEKAKADGVQVELKIWDEMWHVWHMLGGLIPESKKTLEEIGEFVRAQYQSNISK